MKPKATSQIVQPQGEPCDEASNIFRTASVGLFQVSCLRWVPRCRLPFISVLVQTNAIRAAIGITMSLVIGQTEFVLAEPANSVSDYQPTWRSRGEMAATNQTRLVERTGIGRASLGSPIATTSSAQTPSSLSQPTYRQVPSSPWERPAQGYAPSSTPNMIRQPSADRQSNSPQSNSPQSQMTLDLSGYQKPQANFDRSTPSNKFISQPKPATQTVDSDRLIQKSDPNNLYSERLPQGGVALSNELDNSPIGLGYPAVIQYDESGNTNQTLKESVPLGGEHSLNPREATRSLPASSNAVRKAALILDRSKARDAERVRYAQQRSKDQARLTTPTDINQDISNQFDSESTAQSNVIGVIAAPTPLPRSTTKQLIVNESHEDFPYSTDDSIVIPASMASNRLGNQRIRTASRVSAELLDGSQSPLADSPLPLEPPTGWKTIEKSLKTHLENCDDLLRRGAVLSAREEVLMGMRVLYRAIDLRTGTWTSEPAMDQALAAFNEEADFYQTTTNSGSRMSTESIVSGHATHALKQTQLYQVSPDLAAQHYRSYAKQQWLIASQEHPWASDLLYAYGKTLEREAENLPSEALMRRSQAVVCYQAALEIRPQNASDANQLGYALLQLDRVDEAQLALNHSIQVGPKVETWNNLAEVYRRRGQADQVAYAQRNAMQLQETGGPARDNMPVVTEVDVRTFASVSPYQYGAQNNGAQNMASAAPIQASTSNQPAPVQSASATAPVKSNWFGKFFR